MTANYGVLLTGRPRVVKGLATGILLETEVPSMDHCGRTKSSEEQDLVRSTSGPGACNGVLAVAAGEHIYSEGSLPTSVYRIDKGLVSISRMRPGGKRHIVMFRGQGEWLGMAAGGLRQEFAEAASPVRLRVHRFSATTQFHAEILNQVLEDVAKAHNRQVMLTEKVPVRRLAAFLLERVDRVRSEQDIEIPVSRRDLADYLGLTVETVARCFTKLVRRDVIRLHGTLRRSVHVIDRDALAALSTAA